MLWLLYANKVTSSSHINGFDQIKIFLFFLLSRFHLIEYSSRKYSSRGGALPKLAIGNKKIRSNSEAESSLRVLK